MMSDESVEHGTYSGWNWHMRRHEPACDACRAANSQYQDEWRKTSKGKRSSAIDVRARGRALTRLARMHPSDYRDLYAEEKWKAEREYDQQTGATA